ncbi:MAG: hypothetical protein A2X49_09755 [Lentisphaerae bacterium GWF2_52_8]|nr:MAG: hypothetical protein A2X49_09755 [Lentisphaerae bacterium GWF2_52_8]
MDSKLFSFGVVADIQYADKDTLGRRAYRDALGKLEQCVADWNRQTLAFAVELGDLSDDREKQADCECDVKNVLKAFALLRHPLHRVLGNHGLGSLGYKRSCKLLEIPEKESWKEFSHCGWRFIFLNSMVMNAIAPDSPAFAESRRFFEDNRGDEKPEIQDFNGGLGQTQRAWLTESLKDAETCGERVLAFCHLPLCPEASSYYHLPWDYREVLEIIDSSPAPAAFFTGHDHNGGYALRKGVHHVTFPGLIEAEPNAYASVEVFPDKLVIKGAGNMADRLLRL